MERNVLENNLSDVITAFNKGVGKDEFVTINPQFVSGTQTQLKDQEKGVPIEVVSLNRIVRENMKDEFNAVLKMNCEGCEYDTIMGADDETIKHFSDLRIDYHFGIRDLVSRLRSLEYNVRYSEPIRAHDRSSTVPDMELGWIRANKSIPAT
jgi:FkbM family methyltransferase